MTNFWRKSRNFSILIFCLLLACSRHPPTDEEASKAVKSCGLVMKEMNGAGGFDTAYNIIETKKIPQEEFYGKASCLKMVFFFSNIQASVNNGESADYIDIGI